MSADCCSAVFNGTKRIDGRLRVLMEAPPYAPAAHALPAPDTDNAVGLRGGSHHEIDVSLV